LSTALFGAAVLAFGANVLAFGTASLAFGANVLAFGTASLAFGANVLAFGAASLAFGANALAFGTAAVSAAFGAADFFAADLCTAGFVGLSNVSFVGTVAFGIVAFLASFDLGFTLFSRAMLPLRAAVQELPPSCFAAFQAASRSLRD
jgi:hypothetical protein